MGPRLIEPYSYYMSRNVDRSDMLEALRSVLEVPIRHQPYQAKCAALREKILQRLKTSMFLLGITSRDERVLGTLRHIGRRDIECIILLILSVQT
jgi:hypothetical protein